MRIWSFSVSFAFFLAFSLVSIGVSKEDQKAPETSEAYSNLTVLGKVLDYSCDVRSVSIECEKGAVLKLSVICDDVIRMQVAPQRTFDDSLMIRWGFVYDDQYGFGRGAEQPIEFVLCHDGPGRVVGVAEEDELGPGRERGHKAIDIQAVVWRQRNRDADAVHLGNDALVGRKGELAEDALVAGIDEGQADHGDDAICAVAEE